MNFILKWGVMDGLFSDNAKAQTSKAVADILGQYKIYDMQSEPYQQNQNYADRRIQEVKSMTNTLMDRTGSPGFLWLLCMMYCVFLLNRLAAASLGWRTSIEVAFKVTPDISVMLFAWYEPVFYYTGDSAFPGSKEKRGHFIGFSESIGDALTFNILTDEAQEIIHRSAVRSALDPANPNRRLRLTDGEQCPISRGFDADVKQGDRMKLPEKEAILMSYADNMDPSRLNLPSLNPESILGMTFLCPRDVDGSIHRAEVLKRIETRDDEACRTVSRETR